MLRAIKAWFQRVVIDSLPDTTERRQMQIRYEMQQGE